MVFFDGECAFCNQSVRRLVKWDKKGLMHYAPLQGELAALHGLQEYLSGDEASMVVLNEKTGEIQVQSDGAIQILRLLGGPWRLLLWLGWLPRSVRNRLYRILARNRQYLGGREEAICDLPDKNLLSRLRE